jgi:beta-lactamase regulating signal transducer with metallopeptidase domain
MTTAWLVYVLVVGALLALGASALARALRALGRSTRGVYAAAVAGTIALAVIAPRSAPLPMNIAPRAIAASASSAPMPDAVTLGDRLRVIRDWIDRTAITAIGALDRAASPVSTRIAITAWATASTLLLTLFVLVNRRLLVARRRWPSREMHGVSVRVAPDMGPAVLGLLRAEIVVPRSLLDRPRDEQRLVLAHEREHLRARDHLLLGGAWLGAIAFPWHPAVWYLVNRIRLAIELDCDARILRGGASPQSYGALLIDMAARGRPAQVGALALVDGASHLERRILAMKPMKGRHVMVRGVALAAIGGLLALAACEARVPTAAEVQQLDVGTFEKKAQELALVDAKISKADYFVNGVPTSAADARAIDAKMIGSVEVVKSELPSGRDTIIVTTVDFMPKQTEMPVALRRAASAEPGLVRDSTWDRELAREGILPSGDEVQIVIDGKRSSQRDLAALRPEDIVEVSIRKSTDSTPSSGREASDGVIRIRTKRAKAGS